MRREAVEICGDHIHYHEEQKTRVINTISFDGPTFVINDLKESIFPQRTIQLMSQVLLHKVSVIT